MPTDSHSLDAPMPSSSPMPVARTLSGRVNRYRIPIAIFVIALLLRVWAIATPLNTDEAKWLGRGAEFIHHLFAGAWGETYTTPHPGVPNMWVIGIGMGINRLLGNSLGQGWPNIGDMPETLLFPDTLFPIHWYILPRLLQALISSACMAGFYELAKRLLGRAIALIAVIILLFEPFFLSYQRFITTDALQTNFGILGVLGLVYYLQRHYFYRSSESPHTVVTSGAHRTVWTFSAVMMGLAIASKWLTLLVIPGLFLWIMVMVVSNRSTLSFKRQTIKGLALDLLKWAGVVLLSIFVLWPALWTQPGFTFNRVIEGLMDEEARSYFFFWGEATDAPGLLFYPVVLALRLSPWLWMGLLGAAITFGCPTLRRQVYAESQDQSLDSTPVDLSATCGALMLISLGYLIILSGATTKLDRYISLVIPLLAILAAVGWIGLGILVVQLWNKPKGGQPRSLTHPAPSSTTQALREYSPNSLLFPLALLIATGQLVLLLPHMPYGLTYYNPTLGGIQNAQQMLMVGQGEGLDKMAQWLNQQPGAENMTVASWYRSVLAAYFKGNVSPLSIDRLPDERFWTASHRVVLYKNQLQRQLPSAEFVDYIQQQRSLHTVTEHGVEYAIAYPGPIALDIDLEQIQHSRQLAFGNRLHLAGYDLEQTNDSSSHLRQEDSDSNRKNNEQAVLTLYWTIDKKLPADLGVYVEVKDKATQVISQSTTPLLQGLYPSQKLTPGITLRDVHVLPIGDDASYEIQVGWRSLASPSGERPIFGRPKLINRNGSSSNN